MSGDDFKAVLYLIGGGAALLYHSYGRLRRKRLFEDTPTSKTRSAAQGLAEFQGYAWPRDKTVMCSQQNECVYYQFSLQKYVKKKKNSHWVTVFSYSHNHDFFLLDSTGIIHIETHGAHLELQKRTQNWSALNENSKQLIQRNFIREASIPGFPPASGFISSLFSSSFRIQENYILLGSPLLVLGNFSSQVQVVNGAPLEIPSCPGMAAFFEKVGTDARLKIGVSSSFFDLNQDGRVDSSELRRSLHYMARSIYNAALKDEKDGHPRDRVHLQLHGRVSKSSEHALTVIDSHQHHYEKESKSFWWYCEFVFGAGLVLTGIYLILVKFQI